MGHLLIVGRASVAIVGATRVSYCTMRAAIIALGLCVSVASAAPPPDPGTRLILEDDDGPAKLVVDAPPPPEAPGEGVSLGVRSHWVTLPNGLLDYWLLDHPTFNSYDIGLELGIDGPAGSRIVFGVDYLRVAMPDGNYRSTTDTPPEASFTKVDMHMISLDVLFLWKLEFSDTFAFQYGPGIGVGYTPGTVTSTDVLPTCTKPLDDCAHWRHVTTRDQSVFLRWWPLLSFQVGLTWKPIPNLLIRAETGARLALIYTGLSVGTTF